MDPAAALDRFLGEAQSRAYRIALVSVRNRDVALDMVQDAMIRLAQKYAHKPETEWPPLFYRILQNRIRDWQRKQMVRNKVMLTPGKKNQDDHEWQPVEQAPDTHTTNPAQLVQNESAMQKLNDAVSELPQRQREVFLLRAIEELSVAQTAASLEISEGSIKTHYSRALAALREQLGDHWP